MLGDITIAQNIYIACGYTDMRKSIDTLAALVKQKFQMNPCQPALFLFCGRRHDRLKALLWEPTGFVLLYKRFEVGTLKWPSSEDELHAITWSQFEQLMAGFHIEERHPILPANPGDVC